MSDYTFETLNDKEFEELVKDLLEKELKVKLQSFKKGKDKGIDLRYSSVKDDNEIIIQAKHYVNSQYYDLKRTMEKVEKNKVNLLNPSRYILATSIGLTPNNVTEIKGIMSPYIKNIEDIFWKEQLNTILSKYPEIEDKHYKLWFSSINVFKNILNNGIKGRSKFFEDKIKKSIALFVPSKCFNEALEMLTKNKFIIITGEPGVGKTTLADVLTYNFLGNGYELIYIDEKIQDAEQMLNPNIESKQIFYFDDFLGANYLEIANPKNSDSAIVNFIERIMHIPNKYLILTTRTIVLNYAKQNSEKIRRARVDISQFEVALKEYSLVDKAKILYNHLYFNNVKAELLESIKEDENYLSIIKHKNYTPRLIEFFTKPFNFEQFNKQNYVEFIMSNLNNPAEVWNDHFETQLEDEDRFLLITLFTLGNNVEENCLEEAFRYRIKYEINENGLRLNNNIFNRTIKKLVDGFIKIEITSGDIEKRVYNFINPGVVDFIINYIEGSKQEKIRIVKSIYYIEQLTKRFTFNKKSLDVQNTLNYQAQGYISVDSDIKKELLEHITKNYNQFKSINDENFIKELEMANIVLNYLSDLDIKFLLLEILKNLNINKLTAMHFEKMINLMQKAFQYYEVREVILNQWDGLVLKLFEIIHWEDNYTDIIEIFNLYNKDLNSFFKNNQSTVIESLRRYIERWLNELLSDTYEFQQEVLESMNDEGTIYEGYLRCRVSDRIRYFLDDSLEFCEQFGFNWYDIVNLDNKIKEYDFSEIISDALDSIRESDSAINHKYHKEEVTRELDYIRDMFQ
jgi:hypothetical protein